MEVQLFYESHLNGPESREFQKLHVAISFYTAHDKALLELLFLNLQGLYRIFC